MTGRILPLDEQTGGGLAAHAGLTVSCAAGRRENPYVAGICNEDTP